MENVNLTIRIPPDLLDQLRTRAKQEDRTLASLIRVLLAQGVKPTEPPLTDWGGKTGDAPTLDPTTTSDVSKFGIWDRVAPAEVPNRTDQLRAALLGRVARDGYVLDPTAAEPVVQVLEPMAEDDGSITQEIRVSVRVYQP